MRTNHAAEIRGRLRDPVALVQHLGISEGSRRQQRGVMVLCPSHAEKTPSCSVRVAPDGTIQVRCHGCGFTADALGLVAAVRGWDTRRDFQRVLAEAAAMCGYALDGPSSPLPPPRPKLVPPPPKRPPREEVEETWAACLPVNTLGEDEVEVIRFLLRRGMMSAYVAPLDVVRVMPRDPPRRAWWPRVWTGAWRLVTRAYDAGGVVRSLHARAVLDVDGPKTRWPYDCRADGLLFANREGAAMLRREREPSVVMVVEGLTDTVMLSTQMAGQNVAVLGITSGSGSALREIRWPSGIRVLVATDEDEAGERYARQVVEALPETVVAARHRRAKGA